MIRKIRLTEKIKKGVYFVQREVWQIPLKDLPPRKSFLIKQLRIFILAMRGFKEDELFIRASSLTYYTLLATVPVVAMAFGIAKGFGLEAFVESQLREIFSGREEVFNWIMEFAYSMLETTQGGLIAGVGLIILIYTIVIVLIYVEETFNGIWQIKKPRPFSRRVSDYFAMMFVAPLFVILSSAVTVFLSTRVAEISDNLQFLTFLSPALMFLVNLIPYVLIWTVFLLIYMVMPNTNVKFSSALIAAVIAGTLFILVQWAYIYFQVGVSRYNAIYGSFAALPLLLFWIRISWLIVLFGAEISFANQNVDYYEFEHESRNISQFNKKILALYMYNLIARRFANGDIALTPPEIALKLEMPIVLVREVLDDMSEIGLVAETKSKHHKENAYQPGSDINKVTVKTIVDKLENQGTGSLIIKETEELDEFKRTLRSFSNAISNSPENKLVKDF